jgi:DNA mismatch endonuclease Vsr
MARVRQSGTAPELRLRSILRKLKIRFKSNPRFLAGSPDIFVTESRRAIFVHGCFWHRHKGCKASTTPKSNSSFWRSKFLANQFRDRRKTRLLRVQEYPLETWKASALAEYTRMRRHGTIVYFERVKEGIRTSFPLLEKIIALYFRFSLLDPTFKIFLNGKQITHKHLKELVEKTEFLWTIGNRDDPYVDSVKSFFAKKPEDHETKQLQISDVKGFIASVEKPRDLKVMDTEERIGVDLFVNGRLRERDILKRIPIH